jgi:hypothetical protein
MSRTKKSKSKPPLVDPAAHGPEKDRDRIKRLVRELRVLNTMIRASTALALLDVPMLHPSRHALEEVEEAAAAAMVISDSLIESGSLQPALQIH